MAPGVGDVFNRVDGEEIQRITLRWWRVRSSPASLGGGPRGSSAGLGSCIRLVQARGVRAGWRRPRRRRRAAAATEEEPNPAASMASWPVLEEEEEEEEEQSARHSSDDSCLHL
jgi:hypothetical protein